MVNHVLLYAVNISVHSYDTDGGVGRAQIARYIQVTPKTAAKRMEELITSGYAIEVKVPTLRGHGFKFLYNLTDKGLQYLSDNWQEVHADFYAWQTQRLMEELQAVRKPTPTKKSKKQKKQEAAGQKELF